VKQIKLPRKRKKAYIKKHGAVEYMAATIIGEIIGKPKYPEIFGVVKGKLVILFYW